MVNFESLFEGVYKDKKVLLTGHTGFKGPWLALWLKQMGAKVYGFSLKNEDDINHLSLLNLGIEEKISDIRNADVLEKYFQEVQPDIVFHLAAQALVRRSYDDPVETFSTNVMGTLNIFEACRKTPSVKAIINVTTDKCYENKEWEWGYRENEPMGGYDPYSASKGCSELLTSSYRNSYFNLKDFGNKHEVLLASGRAGNVIGGGDWATDRLIPDIVKATANNEAVLIRNPIATRPWQHVLEPLSGYLVLAENLYNNGDVFAEAWNFGPNDEDCKPVNWILDKMVAQWGKEASWELDKNNNPHEAGFLKLDCSKAASRLKWQPKWSLEETLNLIIDWHQNYMSGNDVQVQCLKEIKKYSSQ